MKDTTVVMITPEEDYNVISGAVGHPPHSQGSFKAMFEFTAVVQVTLKGEVR